MEKQQPHENWTQNKEHKPLGAVPAVPAKRQTLTNGAACSWQRLWRRNTRFLSFVKTKCSLAQGKLYVVSTAFDRGYCTAFDLQTVNYAPRVPLEELSTFDFVLI